LRNKLLVLFIIKRVVAVSNFVKKRLVKSGINRDKVKTIYNGIDLNRYNHSGRVAKGRLRDELNIPQDTLIISTIANLIPEKGIDCLLEAAKQVLLKSKNTLFLIVGAGKEMSFLKKLSQDLGITDHVIFLGFRDDMESILSSTDIFVCPSIWKEAFGLVIAEAMGCAKPVIASKVGGIPELVEDGITGILVPPGDSEKLAVAINQLIQNKDLRIILGKAGRKRAEKYFHLEGMVQRTINLYGSL